MASELDSHVPTYAVVHMSKKKKHSADKNDDQPEILSDFPATYSKLNREKNCLFIQMLHSIMPHTPWSHWKICVQTRLLMSPVRRILMTMLLRSKVLHARKTCRRTGECHVSWLSSLFLVVMSIAAFVEISQLKSEISFIRGTSSYNTSSLSHHVKQTIDNKCMILQEELNSTNSLNLVLSQNYSALEKYTFHLGNETDHRLNELEIKVNQTFSAVAMMLQRLFGLYHNHPATSCASILQFAPSSPSGHYWIRSSNGSAVRVYCDMTRSCGNITGGWMRVAELDMMRDCCSQCPSDLYLGTACNLAHTCVINSYNVNCSSVFFTTHGFNYSRVCGMIRAYQVGTPDGFEMYGIHEGMSSPTIEYNYVDGISLTHGSSPRIHIWTFAAAQGICLFIFLYTISVWPEILAGIM